MPNSSSFTVRSSGGVLRVLQTPCELAPAFDPTVGPIPQFHSFQAIWDTGATNSVITQAVVDRCGLQPIGMTQVQGVNSSVPSEVYLVTIGLLNQVKVQSVRVTKGTLAGAVDVLIGMDVITIGDFVVTNLNGTTVFSFCVPSHRCIDFVEEHNAQIKAQPRPGFRGYMQPQQPGGKKPRRHR
jgi:predicted aspartyl protease